MSMADWSPLISALDAWQAEGRVARFWLRDDDAVEPTPALARLLDLGRRHHVPLALAVIPAHVVEALADILGDHADASVILHGWSHENHAPQDQKKQELGAHRPAQIVLGELAEGLARLQSLFGARLSPMLVPPWNRIDKALLPELDKIGVKAISTFGPEKPSSLPAINTHADVMDWHGTRGCRPAADIIADVVRRLEEMPVTDGTMGLLTHHLVHDEAAWQFIDGIFAATANHPGCRWCGVPELMAAI
ncbi:polysaccharide deacetylase family protein [Rhizobium sp.]